MLAVRPGTAGRNLTKDSHLFSLPTKIRLSLLPGDGAHVLEGHAQALRFNLEPLWEGSCEQMALTGGRRDGQGEVKGCGQYRDAPCGANGAACHGSRDELSCFH